MMGNVGDHPMQVLRLLDIAKFLEDVDEVGIKDLLFIMIELLLFGHGLEDREVKTQLDGQGQTLLNLLVFLKKDGNSLLLHQYASSIKIIFLIIMSKGL